MDVARALGTYLEIVDACAPGYVEGLYVVGSYALGDWWEGRSDIDVVAVTAEAATDDDAGTLLTAHALLAEQPGLPAIDGPYVAWGDLITPPTSLHRPWTSGAEFHHDAECSDINPITWYVLAEHGVTVRGPTVDRLGVYVEVDARVRFAVDDLRGHWAGIASRIEEVLAGDPGGQASADLLTWCAFGPLRLHRTAFHGDVISKSDAAAYGLEVAPREFAPVLELALALRRGEAVVDVVDASEVERCGRLIRWCIDEVVRAVDAPVRPVAPRPGG